MRVGVSPLSLRRGYSPKLGCGNSSGAIPCRDGCQPCFLGERPHCFFTTTGVLADAVAVAGAAAAAVAVAVAVAAAAAAALLVEWGRSLLWFEHFCIFLLISKTRFFYVNTSTGNRHFIEHGNLMPELTLTPHCSWL
jgi:hypothetical protein